MLAVRSASKDEKQGEVASFSIGADDFPDFDDDTNLLDSINFDDLFVGINDGDVLPDLEMDPEILAEFSVSAGEESELNASASASTSLEKFDHNSKSSNKDEEDEEHKDSASRSCAPHDQEIVSSKREEPATPTIIGNPLVKLDGDKTNKSKNCHGKRKVKVINDYDQYQV